MTELGPKANKEINERREYGISYHDLEKDDGEIMLGIYKIFREKVSGSILTVDPDRVPRSYVMHLLRDIKKMKDPNSKDTRFKWGSDLSSESYLWVSRIQEKEDLTVRFSLNISDFIYLSDDAQNDAVITEQEFNHTVNDYLKNSGVGVEI